MVKLTLGLLQGRKTGISLDEAVFSAVANKQSNLISFGSRLHQLSVATAIFP